MHSHNSPSPGCAHPQAWSSCCQSAAPTSPPSPCPAPPPLHTKPADEHLPADSREAPLSLLLPLTPNLTALTIHESHTEVNVRGAQAVVAAVSGLVHLTRLSTDLEGLVQQLVEPGVLAPGQLARLTQLELRSEWHGFGISPGAAQTL